MSADEERVRYDRQVRLWGRTTQERLSRTHLHLCSTRGALAEVAKNLVLAGVHSATVEGASALTASDVADNFLVQCALGSQDVRGCTFEEVCAAALAALNPHVRARAGDEGGDAAGGIRVVLGLARSLTNATRLVAAHPTADVVVISVSVGGDGESPAGVLSLFLRAGAGRPPLADQLVELACSPAHLARCPAAYQAAVLDLHLADVEPTAGFPASLAAAAVCVARLGLRELGAAAVEGAVRRACAGQAPRAPPATLATQAGACIAQQVVALVGDEAGPATRWLLCTAAPAMETLVG